MIDRNIYFFILWVLFYVQVVLLAFLMVTPRTCGQEVLRYGICKTKPICRNSKRSSQNINTSKNKYWVKISLLLGMDTYVDSEWDTRFKRPVFLSQSLHHYAILDHSGHWCTILYLHKVIVIDPTLHEQLLANKITPLVGHLSHWEWEWCCSNELK